MRAFLDANVLFTAAYNPEGGAHALLRAKIPGCAFITCTLAVEEARRNLDAKGPERSLQRLDGLLKDLEVFGTLTSGTCPFPLPAKDRPIYESAKALGATHLLTGDLKDFGPYMNCPTRTEGILIQTVRDFLEAL